MTTRLALSTLAVVAVVAGPSASVGLPPHAFLTEAFGVSSGDLTRIDRGGVVTRSLAVKNRREVATLGVVRIRTTPDVYVERLRDIAAFKRTEDIIQIGKFSEPPRLKDLAPLTIDDADIRQLRECQVEECGVRLSADDIGRVRQEIDWRAADAPARAGTLLRQMLVDHVTRYHAGGAAAAIEYAGRSPRLDAGREFADLVAADTTTWPYVPHLRRHLLEYPDDKGHAFEDFIYWSKERVHRRLVISMTHVAITPAAAPVSVAIASKQIYAMHYFDASLGLTLLVPATDVPEPATYVIYLNRSRIDLFDGIFGGVARRIVAGKARTLVGEQLARLQKTLS